MCILYTFKKTILKRKFFNGGRDSTERLKIVVSGVKDTAKTNKD